MSDLLDGSFAPVTFAALVRRPSGYLPIVLSVAALSTVLVHVAIHGTARQADEGTAAHLFQLLLVLELPMVGYFALAWLPRAPRSAGMILGLQLLAILAALAPVFLLGF